MKIKSVLTFFRAGAIYVIPAAVEQIRSVECGLYMRKTAGGIDNRRK